MLTNRRVFDWSNQERFARVSCDCNPIHLDAIAARRTHFGAPIVHGVHSLVWLLDCLAQNGIDISGAATLRARFLQPIYVGDEASFELTSSTSKTVRTRITVGSEEVLVASLGFEAAGREHLPIGETHPVGTMPPDAPHNLNLQEMSGLTGYVLFGPLIAEISTLFPSAVAVFGMERIAALVGSSCIVGMLVPGLHSMFSGLEVSLVEDRSAPSDGLQFAVLSVTNRFRLVRIGIRGRGVHGSLETVSSLPPVRQPRMDRLTRLVSKEEFRNSTALVIGGSRGLGELTSKVIATGGGRVVITYASGKMDADAVVEEIARMGLSCTAMAYSVHKSASEQLAALDVVPTHLYYFATPPIFRRKAGLFDPTRFAEFNLFYVAAFFDLVRECVRLNPQGIQVFYPSSSALDTRPATMTEYSMSKAAAEVLCADLSKFVPRVQVLTRRLPRLLTDQTSSVVQIETIDAISIMLPIVREMHR